MAVMIDGGDFCSSVQKKSISPHGSYGGAEDNSDSYERGSSKSRERKRDRDKDHERSERDHHRRERSERNRDDGHHRNRDHGRRRSYDSDSEERSHRHSRSRSRRDSEEERSHRRSRSRSRSSKRKRNSGFDVAPPSSDGGAAAAPPPTIPGTSPIINMMYMTQQATRHARRVYVGGLPPLANEESVATFFDQVMSAIGGNTAGPGDAVVNVYINREKNFAFVEMRSVEEASNAMALDGIAFQGVTVKVRRPTDYNPSLAAALGPSQPSLKLNLEAVGMLRGSTSCLEGADRIFVGGLPYYLTEVQIRELLESFGSLRGFELVKDKETGNSKGYAFCVYQDTSVTDVACCALNGIKLGSKTLTVRRANQGTAQQENALSFQAGGLPTKVVRLTQAVSVDELKDDEEYEDIVEDMRLEAGKYGSLTSVVIPRPMDEPSPGVGSVFLEFSDTIGAWKAREGLNGRKFGGNEVVAVYYPENKFSQGEYDA